MKPGYLSYTDCTIPACQMREQPWKKWTIFSSVLEVSQVLLVSVISLVHYGFEDIKDVMAILISYRNHQVFFPTPLFKKNHSVPILM